MQVVPLNNDNGLQETHPRNEKAQSQPGAKPSDFNYRRARDVSVAAGMAREQSAGVLCAVLVEEGSATDKVFGSLGLLVMSIIHGVKANAGPLPPPEGRGIIGCPRADGAGRKETPVVIREELSRLFKIEERHRRLLARLVLAFGLSILVYAAGAVL